MACIYNRNDRAGFIQAGCSTNDLSQTVKISCPLPPPLESSCTATLKKQCPIDHNQPANSCMGCIYNTFFDKTQQKCIVGADSGCPTSCDVMMVDYCGRPADPAHPKPQFGPTMQPGEYFQSPHAVGQDCKCINGSTFDCLPPKDDDSDGAISPPVVLHPPGHCSMDIFFGSLWWQRSKQYLLQNGIAVLALNAYFFDGWVSVRA